MGSSPSKQARRGGGKKPKVHKSNISRPKAHAVHPAPFDPRSRQSTKFTRPPASALRPPQARAQKINHPPPPSPVDLKRSKAVRRGAPALPIQKNVVARRAGPAAAGVVVPTPAAAQRKSQKATISFAPSAQNNHTSGIPRHDSTTLSHPVKFAGAPQHPQQRRPSHKDLPKLQTAVGPAQTRFNAHLNKALASTNNNGVSPLSSYSSSRTPASAMSNSSPFRANIPGFPTLNAGPSTAASSARPSTAGSGMSGISPLRPHLEYFAAVNQEQSRGRKPPPRAQVAEAMHAVAPMGHQKATPMTATQMRSVSPRPVSVAAGLNSMAPLGVGGW